MARGDRLARKNIQGSLSSLGEGTGEVKHGGGPLPSLPLRGEGRQVLRDTDRQHTIGTISSGGSVKKSLFVMVAVLALTFLLPYAAQAQLGTKKALTLEAAKKIAAVAEAEALRNKWAVVITIVDDGGNLLYLERMDNTQIGSIEVAIQKAKAAIFFKRPTKVYEDLVAQGKTDILGVPGVIPIEGGLPLVVDGQYIGAIGVSGGTRQQDGIVAKAAVEAFAAH